jgi:hypothetical protein
MDDEFSDPGSKKKKKGGKGRKDRKGTKAENIDPPPTDPVQPVEADDDLWNTGKNKKKNKKRDSQAPVAEKTEIPPAAIVIADPEPATDTIQSGDDSRNTGKGKRKNKKRDSQAPVPETTEFLPAAVIVADPEPIIDRVQPAEADDNLWSSGKNKKKNKKRDPEPPAEIPPTAIAVAGLEQTFDPVESVEADGDFWTTGKSKKKSKKRDSQAPAAEQTENAPEAIVVADLEPTSDLVRSGGADDDSWNTGKSKKNKKRDSQAPAAEKHEAILTAIAVANPNTDPVDAGDDLWNSGKSKKKNRKRDSQAPAAETPPTDIADLEPTADPVDAGDTFWNTGKSKKKSKKRDSQAPAVEKPEDTPATVVADIEPDAAASQAWKSTGKAEKKRKKGKNGKLALDRPGSDDDTVAATESQKPVADESPSGIEVGREITTTDDDFKQSGEANEDGARDLGPAMIGRDSHDPGSETRHVDVEREGSLPVVADEHGGSDRGPSGHPRMLDDDRDVAIKSETIDRAAAVIETVALAALAGSILSKTEADQSQDDRNVASSASPAVIDQSPAVSPADTPLPLAPEDEATVLQEIKHASLPSGFADPDRVDAHSQSNDAWPGLDERDREDRSEAPISPSPLARDFAESDIKPTESPANFDTESQQNLLAMPLSETVEAAQDRRIDSASAKTAAEDNESHHQLEHAEPMPELNLAPENVAEATAVAQPISYDEGNLLDEEPVPHEEIGLARSHHETDAFDRRRNTPLARDASPHTTESRPTAIELTAALAAGLQDAGFDPALALQDAPFAEPSAARTLEEPDFDDIPQHASMKSSRRSSRRQSRAQSRDRSGLDSGSTIGRAITSDEPNFESLLAAGLERAGFDANVMATSDGEREDEADMVEISAMRRRSSPSWNRPTRARGESPQEDHEPQYGLGVTHVGDSPRADLKRDEDRPGADVAVQASPSQFSIRDATTQGWSFPQNRDSAIAVDYSPVLPDLEPSSSRDRDRDSGFQDHPRTPDFKRDSQRHPTSKPPHASPKSPIQVQVDAVDDWDVTVSQGSPRMAALAFGASQSFRDPPHDGLSPGPPESKGSRTPTKNTHPLAESDLDEREAKVPRIRSRSPGRRYPTFDQTDELNAQASSPSTKSSTDELKRRAWPPIPEEEAADGLEQTEHRPRQTPTRLRHMTSRDGPRSVSSSRSLREDGQNMISPRMSRDGLPSPALLATAATVGAIVGASSLRANTSSPGKEGLFVSFLVRSTAADSRRKVLAIGPRRPCRPARPASARGRASRSSTSNRASTSCLPKTETCTRPVPRRIRQPRRPASSLRRRQTPSAMRPRPSPTATYK